MNLPGATRVPHTLRLATFFLRVALGLNFFYIGFSTLFNPTLAAELRERSVNSLYEWLASPSSVAWLHSAAQWAFLVIGVCLVIGFATRLASLLGIVLVGISYLPTINFANINLSQLANDELVVLLCLIILFVAKAGTYFGLDRFFHFSFRHRK